MSLKNGVIDYIYTNYDVKEVKRAYEETSETLRNAQFALDRVNNSAFIESDL